MRRIEFFLLALFFLTALGACGHRSLEGFQEEGEGIIRSLIQELQGVHNRQELLGSSVRLQQQFERLVCVMIAAQEFYKTHPESDKIGLLAKSSDLSDQLRAELNRIYRLDGGRQIIEKCQEKAWFRLDAFEKQKII